jgi:hypothetical protein
MALSGVEMVATAAEGEAAFDINGRSRSGGKESTSTISQSKSSQTTLHLTER